MTCFGTQARDGWLRWVAGVLGVQMGITWWWWRNFAENPLLLTLQLGVKFVQDSMLVHEKRYLVLFPLLAMYSFCFLSYSISRIEVGHSIRYYSARFNPTYGKLILKIRHFMKLYSIPFWFLDLWLPTSFFSFYVLENALYNNLIWHILSSVQRYIWILLLLRMDFTKQKMRFTWFNGTCMNFNW